MSLKLGETVRYVDARGRERPALVTAIHGSVENDPSINLVIVSDDEERHDAYGRQIERETSVVHESDQGADGNFWR
ncbi:hypothetical protein LCGC14_0251200 [marine sediment metagenome]|uniref:Hypervirulence associated protein TUDOR domain-containing protein n=1 Tax=marine sediment metagenome TaxID=412755 RepID=A0A0F9X8V6_9ZZZZ